MEATDQTKRALTEISEWFTLMPASPSDAAETRGARIGSGGGQPGKRAHSPAPGNVDRMIDTWDEDGAAGIHSRMGVRQALGPWAEEVHAMRHAVEGVVARDVEPHAYLLYSLDWARQRMVSVQLSYMESDIMKVHDRMQQLVHPNVDRDGTCPNCGARIEWIMGSEGRVNLPSCPNGCKLDNLAAQTLRRIRMADQQDAPAYATLAEVKVLYPDLKSGTLRKWVFEGKIRKNGDKYCVNDIGMRHADNQKQQQKTA